MDRRIVALFIALCLTISVSAQAGEGPAAGAAGKKLIEYGWDVPTPDFIAGHIREMERRPFDGLIFRLQGGSSVFDPVPWDDAKFKQDFETLPKIEWRTFTDNFVIMLAASNQDWFSDAHWSAIEANTRMMTKAAKLAKCVGVCFDAEPYGDNPWAYTTAVHHDTKSFADYEAIARKRGGQFIRAVEKELPNPKVLTFFLDSLFMELCLPMPDELRKQRLSAQSYALYPAFLEGMLEGSGPGAEFIDGNENAYYYSDDLSYFNVYHVITQRARYMVGPQYWSAYRAKVRAGQALYIDQYYGLRKEKVLGNYMTPEDQPKWLQHNTYWALFTTDKYVWCYSERMNWWKNVDVPQDSEKALALARAAIDAGRSLDVDLKPIVQAAKERESADIQNRMVRRQADVKRLASDTARPSIDGDLSDVVWKGALPLEPFRAPASRPAELQAQTEARLLYDDKAVYIAFLCHEPKPEKMKTDAVSGDQSSMFAGDVVEVFISTLEKRERFLHFAVNPKGGIWTGIHDGARTDPLTAPWEHAAQIGKDSWTVEIAIPWSALGVSAPSPGLKFRANLGRERFQGGEVSTWRSVANTFLEPDNFGSWIFR